MDYAFLESWGQGWFLVICIRHLYAHLDSSILTLHDQAKFLEFDLSDQNIRMYVILKYF